MNKSVLSDDKAREKIATELNKNLFVEAGAGSGKTHSLVDRMTGIVRYGHACIENIAAVTFTRKAAAELRERFQVNLEEILHEKDVPEKEKDNISKALSNFERASISTIHSFCARLLRERPVEAGIDPGFKEIEEDENIIFARAVWEEYLERQGLERGDIMSWMHEHGINPKVLDGIYIRLVTFPDVEVVKESLPKPDFSAAKKEIEKVIRELRKKMPDSEPTGGWDKLQTTIQRCLKLFTLGYLDEARLFIKLLKILKTDQKVTQKKWADKNTALDSQDRINKLQDDIVRPALRSWSEYLHKPLLEFALGGVEYYDQWRKDRSILNFQDLLMRSANLLRKSKEIRAYFKQTIQRLLIDEFQDTDPIQAEIVMLLTADDDSEDDWRKVVPKPGSLFLVGDPKQSIYRFRRADIDIYNQVKRLFAKGAGEIIELTANFRSLPPIKDITDDVFRNIFPENDTRYQAKFAPLMTIRSADSQYTNGIFENAISRISYNPVDTIAEIDARILAAWIYNSINGGLKLERTEQDKMFGIDPDAKPGDFMIITKQKKRLPLYAKALEALNIPYEISGGENFNTSEDIYEIYKVLHAVADPMNQVALVAALRGMYFGISDDELYKYAKTEGRYSFFCDPDEKNKKIKEAFHRLKEYYDISIKNTPVTAIEKIIEDLGAIPFAVSEHMGSSRSGNLFKAIELLRGSKPDNTGSFAEIVTYLGELREKAMIEEMGLFPGTTKSVRIMNLHKAKGLEAPVVILADPAASISDFDPESHVMRTEKESVGYFTVMAQAGMYKIEQLALPREWERYASEEKLYENAEKDRLDYVAVTRAKNILVVSTYREGSKRKIWESLYPYLDNAPKLKVDKLIDPKQRKEFDMSEDRWIDKKKEIQSSIDSICTKSYDVASVTGIVESPSIFAGEPAKGALWGTVVHRALELCGKGKQDKMSVLAAGLLRQEGLPEGEAPTLLSTIDKVTKSKIWARMLKSEEKYFEIPFCSEKDKMIVTGVIDLIFKEPDGWVIVDYKTDDFETNVKKKAAYQNQVDLYAELWEKITGEKVKERILFKA